MTIQFIWCGKLGKIFLELFLASGIKKENISVVTGSPEGSQELSQEYGVQVGKIENPSLVFLGIKPQQLGEADLSIYNEETLIISPLAGVKTEKIRTEAHVCRVMPNILLQYNYGTTLVYKQKDSQTLTWFLEILGKRGNVVHCETEDELNQLATISGCGPAYFFAFAEAIEALWREHGGDAESGRKTLENLLMGSALYITEGKKTFAESINTVASKWGITQRALDTFAEKGLKDMINAWLREAYKHWNKLSESA